LLVRGHRAYGYPLVIATCPGDEGLGHHSMGAECGANWGHSQCPGPAIKAQKPAILAPAIQILLGDDMATALTVEDKNSQYLIWRVEAILKTARPWPAAQVRASATSCTTRSPRRLWR
jgi:hypothetical protein